MHGNTESTSNGLKTRRFENILCGAGDRLRPACDSWTVILGGVHFELTGDDVTECTGGARGLTEVDLERAYKSQVDPRLNYEQALEMAMRIVARTKKLVFQSARRYFTGLPILPESNRPPPSGSAARSDARRPRSCAAPAGCGLPAGSVRSRNPPRACGNGWADPVPRAIPVQGCVRALAGRVGPSLSITPLRETAPKPPAWACLPPGRDRSWAACGGDG